jgi:5-methylcytosine-specific restriction protein A
MGKIKIKDIKLLFELGGKVHEEEISLKKAVDIAVEKGINETSAKLYIYNYSNMVNGKILGQNMNKDAVLYYLDNLLKTKGEEVLQNALYSLLLHVDRYDNVHHMNLKGLKVILNEYEDKYGLYYDNNFGEEFEVSELTEGTVRSVRINIYERNGIARSECIKHHGCKCAVCGFDFEEIYGKLGSGFIHVHHLTELSEIKETYTVDPINDLRPICPNCHAMVHKKKPAYTIEELKSIIKEQK